MWKTEKPAFIVPKSLYRLEAIYKEKISRILTPLSFYRDETSNTIFHHSYKR